jgi:hypothetical protein
MGILAQLAQLAATRIQGLRHTLEVIAILAVPTGQGIIITQPPQEDRETRTLMVKMLHPWVEAIGQVVPVIIATLLISMG